MPTGNPRSRATGRITLVDVAQAADVSPITVSRALSGKRPVDRELAERVQDAARRLGYFPDPAARALASSRGVHVVLFAPALSDPVHAEILDAALRRFQDEGVPAMVCTTRRDPREARRALHAQLQQRPAGLLLLPCESDDELRPDLATAGIPVVRLLALPADRSEPAVGFDQAQAGAALTRHLIQRGRRRIAFAGAPLDPITRSRLDGWRNAMTAARHHDPKLEWLNPAPPTMALGAQMFEQIMAQRPPVDAIVFSSDVLAQGAILAAARQRVPVPMRTAIAGFDDLPGSDQMPPPMTTVRMPREQIGAQGAAMLLTLMRGGEASARSLDLGYEVVVRRST